MSVMTYDWNGHVDMAISYSHLDDFQMAGKVRMLMRSDLDHEGVVMGARDRIMGLSKRCEELLAGLRFIENELDFGQQYVARNKVADLLAKHGGAS